MRSTRRNTLVAVAALIGSPIVAAFGQSSVAVSPFVALVPSATSNPLAGFSLTFGGTTGLALRSGADVVLFTSRQLVTGTDANASLSISQRVSAGLVAIVQALTVRPRYILAKGGITSSDVATQGLGVQRAMVLGQVLPGVPVWQLGPETRHPGLSYIVFPGNVGGPDALGSVVTALRTPTRS